MTTMTLPINLVQLVRTQACRYFDGDVSSAEAFAVIDRAVLHPLNGTGSLLNAAHAEFDAAVERLIEAGVQMVAEMPSIEELQNRFMHWERLEVAIEREHGAEDPLTVFYRGKREAVELLAHVAGVSVTHLATRA